MYNFHSPLGELSHEKKLIDLKTKKITNKLGNLKLFLEFTNEFLFVFSSLNLLEKNSVKNSP